MFRITNLEPEMSMALANRVIDEGWFSLGHADVTDNKLKVQTPTLSFDTSNNLMWSSAAKDKYPEVYNAKILAYNTLLQVIEGKANRLCIGDDVVIFECDGSIKVGCQEISFDKLELIYNNAKKNMPRRDKI